MGHVRRIDEAANDPVAHLRRQDEAVRSERERRQRLTVLRRKRARIGSVQQFAERLVIRLRLADLRPAANERLLRIALGDVHVVLQFQKLAGGGAVGVARELGSKAEPSGAFVQFVER